MKKFRSAFFGGYQREEVDDYIEALISELERVKTNSGSENAQELEEMKEQVQQERKEKDSLAAHRPVRGHIDSVCHPGGAGQPVPGVGLQQHRNRRRRGGFPRL